jgi:hypothetical protein
MQVFKSVLPIVDLCNDEIRSGDSRLDLKKQKYCTYMSYST